MPKKNKFFEIKNISENTGEIKIYGVISKYAWEEYGEVSSTAFSKELTNLKNVSTIHLRVNSPGGDVFEATTIFNLVKTFAKDNNIEIIGHIDGLAASAASFLILCANKIKMGIGSLFMIHNPLTSVYGNVEKLKKNIELLDKVKEAILDIYCTKSSLTREEISNKMNIESWFSAKEAKEYGFIDEIVENDNSLENIKNIAGEICIQNFMNQEPLKKKLKEIENIKNNKEENMPKNVQELVAMYPELMNEYKEQIKNELNNGEKERIKNAILAERERIEALEKIPVLNDKQKEIVNNAKYKEPKEPKDIMADFFMSNATKAAAEINAIKTENEKNGINNIAPSNGEIDNDDIVNEICKVALTAFNN